MEPLQEFKTIGGESQLRNLGSALWNCTIAEIENLDQVLRDQDVEYQDLKSIVILDMATRRKRALINLGGDLLKFLFSTATSEEVEDLNKRISQIKTNQNSIIHILKVQRF